jgi:hypothetical protein
MSKKHPIFDKVDYGVAEATDPLSKLFRMLLLEFKIRSHNWSDLLTRYVLNRSNGIPPSRRANERGNLPKSLEKSHMTIKSFIKGLRVLEADKVEFYVVIHRGKKRTLKKIRVDLGPEIENPMNHGNEVVNNVEPGADVDKYIHEQVFGKDK